MINNCDEIIKRNFKAFKANLKVLEEKIDQMTIVLITQDRIQSKSFGSKLDYFKLEKLPINEAKLYYQCIEDQFNSVKHKPSIKDQNKLNELICKFDGNIQIL